MGQEGWGIFQVGKREKGTVGTEKATNVQENMLWGNKYYV